MEQGEMLSQSRGVDKSALKITTMTLIIPLNGKVDLTGAFEMLPITIIPLPQPQRMSSRYKIPECKIPGAILSVRYQQHTRGIVRTTGSKFFKNTVTVDLATKSGKTVSVKISADKLQLCGANSWEQGREGAQLLIDNLLKVQESLTRFQSDPVRANTAIDWLMRNVVGQEVQKSAYDGSPILPDNDVDQKDNLIQIPEVDSSLDAHVQENIRFLLRYAQDFKYASQYLNWASSWVRNLQFICTDDLAIDSLWTAMVNYNYALGFNIDRGELARQIFTASTSFTAHYDNAIRHGVTITLPCATPPRNKWPKKRGGILAHTFLVYQSGLVTQSSPDEESAHAAFAAFSDLIRGIRPMIEAKTRQISVLFPPSE